MPRVSCRHLAPPFAVDLRRDLRWFDFTPATPENVGVSYGHSNCLQVPIDRSLVFEEERLFRSVRDGHNVHVLELRSAFSPIAMRQNVMAPDFSPRFDFTA